VEEVHSGLTMAVQFGRSSTIATADIGSAVASIPLDTAVVKPEDSPLGSSSA
jgi:hypothetical protein